MIWTPSPTYEPSLVGMNAFVISAGATQVGDVHDVDAACLALGVTESSQVGVVAEGVDVGNSAHAPGVRRVLRVGHGRLADERTFFLVGGRWAFLAVVLLGRAGRTPSPGNSSG
jgi:hypothetical protein